MAWFLRTINEMRKSMGPSPKKGLDCSDVFINKDLVAVRAGADGDIVHAYGLIRSPAGELTAVQRAILRLRDGKQSLYRL
jgi:hypothetical protein